MTASNLFLLHETASGYALFSRGAAGAEGVAQDSDAVREQTADFAVFSKVCNLTAFQRFASAEEALAEQVAISAGEPTPLLLNFLELNLPKAKKKSTYQLGVSDADLGKNLKESEHGFPTVKNESVRELLRGCLMHFPKFSAGSADAASEATATPAQTEADLDRARCGLAHYYSRNKMQLDPNRQDKPIMNVITVLDSLDKNINTFAMRVREWYSWHFPELAKIVSDNIVFCKVARVVRIRDAFAEQLSAVGEDSKEGKALKAGLTAAVGDSEEVMEEVLKALKISMGQDIVEQDMLNIDSFAKQVCDLASMRTIFGDYLKRKMDSVAPNLSTLVGEHVGARLITHAGSLTNLAKYPASTVQILGAEKALFRALKTKGNTPKYGLLFHSSFIGRAQQKNKGRVSRYLANKCSIASRIDCFGDFLTNTYGEKMREQVEDRLSFLTEGKRPRKNIDVMKEAMAMVADEEKAAQGSKGSSKKDKAAKALGEATPAKEDGDKKKKKKDKKRAREEADDEAEAPTTAEKEPEKKKQKKDKKAAAVEESTAAVVEAEKKKKKKKDKKVAA